MKRTFTSNDLLRQSQMSADLTRALHNEVAELKAKLSTAEARIGRLREAMTLAECQYLGCGGSLTDSEALANTRRVLQEALRNDTPPQAEGASDAQP